MRKLILASAITLMMASCGSSGTPSTTSTDTTTVTVAQDTAHVQADTVKKVDSVKK